MCTEVTKGNETWYMQPNSQITLKKVNNINVYMCMCLCIPVYTTLHTHTHTHTHYNYKYGQNV